MGAACLTSHIIFNSARANKFNTFKGNLQDFSSCHCVCQPVKPKYSHSTSFSKPLSHSFETVGKIIFSYVSVFVLYSDKT